MAYQYRPFLQVLLDALRTLETEPGPMTPGKAELMSYIRQQISAHDSSWHGEANLRSLPASNNSK